VADDGALAGGQSLVPIPDPTKLTTDAINAFRREMETRFAAYEREQALHHEAITQRLDAMDTAVRLATAKAETAAARAEAVAEHEASLLRDSLNRRLEVLQSRADASDAHLRELGTQRAKAIEERFAERDARAELAGTASKRALDAALQAAREINDVTARAAAESTVKAEANFTKLIDAAAEARSALEKNLTAQIQELKERVDRGEGNRAGGQETVTDRRAGQQAQYAAIAIVISALLVAISLYAALHH
jgi:hypothetical protein